MFPPERASGRRDLEKTVDAEMNYGRTGAYAGRTAISIRLAPYGSKFGRNWCQLSMPIPSSYSCAVNAFRELLLPPQTQITTTDGRSEGDRIESLTPAAAAVEFDDAAICTAYTHSSLPSVL